MLNKVALTFRLCIREILKCVIHLRGNMTGMMINDLGDWNDCDCLDRTYLK